MIKYESDYSKINNWSAVKQMKQAFSRSVSDLFLRLQKYLKHNRCTYACWRSELEDKLYLYMKSTYYHLYSISTYLPLCHTTQTKWSKISGLETNIFEIKSMVKRSSRWCDLQILFTFQAENYHNYVAEGINYKFYHVVITVFSSSFEVCSIFLFCFFK